MNVPYLVAIGLEYMPYKILTESIVSPSNDEYIVIGLSCMHSPLHSEYIVVCQSCDVQLGDLEISVASIVACIITVLIQVHDVPINVGTFFKVQSIFCRCRALPKFERRRYWRCVL